jgi:putative peptidoglycan lipid II flippase
LSVIFLAVWGILFLCMLPFFAQITKFMLPGYSESEVSFVSSISLWILFFQVPFLLIGNLISTVLQAEKQFVIPGLAPFFYNIGIILGVILWAPTAGLYAALYGVIIGAVMYVLILIPGLWWFGYRFVPKIELFGTRIKQFFKLFFPRMFSSLVSQIDATVDLSLSSLSGLGSYSSFYLARNLQLLPVSFLGIALSETALPFFADVKNEGNTAKLLDMCIRLIAQIFFIMGPIMIAFTVLRIPITRLVFGGEKFDWTQTVQTAQILSVFALSLPFHTVYYIITRVFFALEDTRTPFIAGALCTAFNTVLSIVFVVFFKLPVWYLALAFGISMTINSAVLFYILLRRLDHVRLLPFVVRITAILLVTVVTGAIVLIVRKVLDGLIFDTTRTINLFFLSSFCIVVEGLVYLYLSWVIIPSELFDTLSLFTRLSIVKKTVSRYKRLFIPAQNMSEEEKI